MENRWSVCAGSGPFQSAFKQLSVILGIITVYHPCEYVYYARFFLMSIAKSARANGQKNVDTVPGKILISTSPATGRKLGEVQAASPEEIHPIMKEARHAQIGWSAIGLSRRLALMRSLKASIYRNTDLIVDTLVAEQ